MPPASVRRPVPRLLLVTDRQAAGGRDLVALITVALDAGLPAVQLRDKDMTGRALYALAERLRVATARTGALLFVNERVDVALAVGADGVQLGAGAMPVADARGLLPATALIGVSTHAPAEIALAAAAGADFALFGPVHPTPSKAGAQGEAALGRAVAAAAIPVLAIGGIGPAEIAAVRATGAAGVAVIRALLIAADPAAATRALLDALA